MKALLRHACSRGTLSASRCAGRALPSQIGGVGGGSIETGVKRRRRKHAGNASSDGVVRSAPDVSDSKGVSDSEEEPRSSGRSSSIASRVGDVSGGGGGSATAVIGGGTSDGGIAQGTAARNDASVERATATGAASTGASDQGATATGAAVAGASSGGVSAGKVAEAKPVPRKKRTVWDAKKGAMVTVEGDESDAPGRVSRAGYEDSAE